MSQGLFLNAIISNAANRFILSFIGVLLGFCLTGGNALSQSNLEYQKRANRYEGTKPKPVSGLGIELLSAHIAYQDDTSTLGERYQVCFFLNETLPVHLLVRELDYKHYYWLDKVEPETPWRTGFSNVYSWPTADVIRHLSRLSLYDLGIVVRLNKSEPSADEWVVPALLYQTGYPATAGGYAFVFRLREDAKIKGAIYRESGGNPIFTQDLGLKRGNRPFWFQWKLLGNHRASAVSINHLVDANKPIGALESLRIQPDTTLILDAPHSPLPSFTLQLSGNALELTPNILPIGPFKLTAENVANRNRAPLRIDNQAMDFKVELAKTILS